MVRDRRELPTRPGNRKPMADFILVAAVSKWGSRTFWLSIALIGVIALGALVVAVLGRWRKLPTEEKLSANEQLAHFRELYEEGEISQGEYDRIRTTLEKQLRAEANLPPRPEPNAGEAPPSPPQAEPRSPRESQD
jgi:hypothetical protein